MKINFRSLLQRGKPKNIQYQQLHSPHLDQVKTIKKFNYFKTFSKALLGEPRK
jgi:hypothetical protein